MSCFFPCNYGSHEEAGGQHHLFGLYPVTGRFSFLVSSTSYKPCGSEPFILCEHFHVRHMPDLGVPLLIGGLALRALLLRAFARNQQYVFLPLPASFSECIHVRRFQLRCSHTVLYIHYKKASQHWEMASPNYGSFYRTP